MTASPTRRAMRSTPVARGPVASATRACSSEACALIAEAYQGIARARNTELPRLRNPPLGLRALDKIALVAAIPNLDPPRIALLDELATPVLLLDAHGTVRYAN